MATRKAESTTLSTIDVISALYVASDAVFGGKAVDIRMDSNAWYRVAWDHGAIMISSFGVVTASGDVSVADILDFTNALPDQIANLLRISPQPAAPEVSEDFSL